LGLQARRFSPTIDAMSGSDPERVELRHLEVRLLSALTDAKRAKIKALRSRVGSSYHGGPNGERSTVLAGGIVLPAKASVPVVADFHLDEVAGDEEHPEATLGMHAVFGPPPPGRPPAPIERLRRKGVTLETTFKEIAAILGRAYTMVAVRLQVYVPASLLMLPPPPMPLLIGGAVVPPSGMEYRRTLPSDEPVGVTLLRWSRVDGDHRLRVWLEHTHDSSWKARPWEVEVERAMKIITRLP
jgi:hypothetical protein